MIPKSAIEQMNVSIIPDKQYELVSFDGEVHIAFVVELEMIIFDKTLRGRFIPVDQTWGILGRNVLNLFPLLLDGPHGNWEVQPDPIL